MCVAIFKFHFYKFFKFYKYNFFKFFIFLENCIINISSLLNSIDPNPH